MAHELVKRNPNVEAHTASFVLEDGTISNIEDVVAAKKVANYLGIEHVVTDICVDEVPMVLEELIGHFTSPFFDSAVVPLFLLSKKIKESDIKVVFSGDGADEVFGGYPRHSYGPILQSSKVLPAIFQILKSLGLLHPKLRRAHSLSRYADDPDQLLLKLISAADDETRQGYGSIFIKKLLRIKIIRLAI